MHVLTVLDHPDPASFSAAVSQRFIEGAVSAGHSTEFADLHAEGFDPRWTRADIEADDSGVVPEDLLKEQSRIARADAICLVFPLFWWGMPAMMKGWVDRVWRYGWAYDQLENADQSVQKPRTGVLLVPAGASSQKVISDGYLEALDTTWMKGTFGYFGFSPRRLEVLYGAEGSSSRRDALLERSYDAGATLPKPSLKHSSINLKT